MPVNKTQKKTVKAKGIFIVVDGGEGSGKSTLMKAAATAFPKAVLTREPGGTPYAEEIRNLILGDSAKEADDNTLFSLFWAARAEHMKTKIKPALTKGKLVISDRFDCTTYAYQIAGRKQYQLENLFFDVREHFLGTFTPDLYIFLDLDPKVGMDRKRKGNAEWNHLDKRKIDFYKNVRKGYKKLATKVPAVFIDASRRLEDVQDEFIKIVKNVISSKNDR
jgi:dTMP kinase